MVLKLPIPSKTIITLMDWDIILNEYRRGSRLPTRWTVGSRQGYIGFTGARPYQGPLPSKWGDGRTAQEVIDSEVSDHKW